MPGLPKKPAAYEVCMGKDGNIQGLLNMCFVNLNKFFEIIPKNFRELTFFHFPQILLPIYHYLIVFQLLRSDTASLLGTSKPL